MAQVQGLSSPTGADALTTLRRSCTTIVPLPVLTLQKEVVLDGPILRLMYRLVELLARLLPFLVIYGGTASLLCCVFFKYRWGVIMSLLLYTVFMCVSSWELVLCGARGIVMCWMQHRCDWHAEYLFESNKGAGASMRDVVAVDSAPLIRPAGLQPPDVAARQAEEVRQAHAAAIKELGWDDVLHVVMVPNYKTPLDVLVATIQQLEHFSLAKTNMGVCLAFEEREADGQSKAQELKDRFHGSFRFVTATFHPPNLPNHVPGKSSNECWAFMELAKELKLTHGYDQADPRVIITVIDDDSEMHANYFEALTYHFLMAPEAERYLTLWQPPIAHFKNYTTQPGFVRMASLFTSLHELACLANPCDCHVPFSSYSLSLILASAVGGWDPDFISEDWHMMAKCCLKTEGRAKCRPIFLPLMNYAPEETTVWGTLKARWTQATRHSLGVSEIVYVLTHAYLGICESGSPLRAVLFVWRVLPLLAKYVSVHFVVATVAIWPFLAHVLINNHLIQHACETAEIDALQTACEPLGIAQEQVILNSWMVYMQQQANVLLFVGCILAGGFGAFYFNLVKDRAAGHVGIQFSNPFLLWLTVELEVCVLAPISAFVFGSIPEWIAIARIIGTTRFYHSVAGMVGRTEDGGALSDDNGL